MKTCSYCGVENPDDAVICSTCHTDFADLTPPLKNRDEMSLAEERFWQRMTFRQFAVLIVRLVALGLFFQALIEATEFLRFLANLSMVISPAVSYPLFRTDAILLMLRIGLRVIVGFVLLFNTEGLLSWLVKGSVLWQPPDISSPGHPRQTNTPPPAEPPKANP